MKKNLIIGSIILALLSGSGGVYAGTLINKGNTPRGNSYSEEKATIEHNKYEVNLDKTKIGNTISMNRNVYVNIKNLPSSKFNLNYNKSKWSYSLTTKHDEIDKLKSQLAQAQADVKQAQSQTDELQKQVDDLTTGVITSNISAKVNGNSVFVSYVVQNKTDENKSIWFSTPCKIRLPKIAIYDNKDKLVASNYIEKGVLCVQVITQAPFPAGATMGSSFTFKNLPKGHYTAKANLAGQIKDYPTSVSKSIQFDVN